MIAQSIRCGLAKFIVTESKTASAAVFDLIGRKAPFLGSFELEEVDIGITRIENQGGSCRSIFRVEKSIDASKVQIKRDGRQYSELAYDLDVQTGQERSQGIV